MNKILLLFFISFYLGGFGQTKELKLASDIWPPFTNIENKKTFAIDLVDEALNRIGYTTEIEITAFENVLNGINSGDFDGSAALWISEERKKNYLFSEPYLHNQLILVGRSGSDVSAASYPELAGKSIGIVEYYAYGDEETGTEEVEFVQGKSDQQNLERLLSEEIDYMLVDGLLIQYLLKFQVNDVTEFLEIGLTPLLVKSLHFALGKDVSNAQQILSLFDKEIHKMISDGSYNEILELNWIQADIDGDGKMEIILDGDKAGKEAPRNIYGVHPSYATEVEDSTKRYYVDGMVYNGWKNIPQKYKAEFDDQIMMESQAGRGIIRF